MEACQASLIITFPSNLFGRQSTGLNCQFSLILNCYQSANFAYMPKIGHLQTLRVARSRRYYKRSSKGLAANNNTELTDNGGQQLTEQANILCGG